MTDLREDEGEQEREQGGKPPVKPQTQVDGGFHKASALRSSITYVRRDAGPSRSEHQNQAIKYVRSMLHTSWSAQMDGQLLTDIQSVMEGGCIYLPSFFCAAKDFGLLAALTRDLEAHAAANSEEGGDSSGKLINWSQHLKHENPDFSPTFQGILKRMDAYFDVEIIATRLNFYRDGKDWKPFHHDSHAYGGNGKKEDFTMGASFGATRELAFLHEPSGHSFTFPQANGDIFAFNTDVNKRFQHGVPKVKGNPAKVGPRISVIAWGRRRSLKERNSSLAQMEDAAAMGTQPIERFPPRPLSSITQPQPQAQAQAQDATRTIKPAPSAPHHASAGKGGNEAVMDMSEMAHLVNTMINKQAPPAPQKNAAASSGGGAEKKRRGGRLQHGWAK